MHHFRDKARYWSKIVIFSIPTLHSTPLFGDSRRNIAMHEVWCGKPEWCSYSKVKKLWRYDYLFLQNPRTWQTDRRTDIAWRHRPQHCAAKMICILEPCSNKWIFDIGSWMLIADVQRHAQQTPTYNIISVDQTTDIHIMNMTDSQHRIS